ncbi:DNA-directed RNA polymerase IV subunit 1 isoform X1 [Senna tora]|uniref:DNA-directed RNA polymerase subunit n=1 Tax=Senna tora TaxID=362788 RepID=A0A834TV44_9FABA|nr:DNA-directed RNA polymerase IV subunit 1 isoform X1 [Senna tora]
MDDDLFHEQKVPSGMITGLKLDIVTETDREYISALQINAVGQVTCSDLGLPNPSCECSTCGSKDRKFCEGHFGVIKFPFPVLHPYFLSEIAEILNKICPGCKSIRQELWFKGAHSKSGNKSPKGCKYCAGSSTGLYPTMKFKVSSTDLFRRTSIIVEINERNLRRKRNLGTLLPADYWDFIPGDAQQEESCLKSNRRVLSPAQVETLLSDVDPSFVEKFVSRSDLVALSSFLVTPNSHRVTDIMHASSNENRLIFDDRTRAYKKLVDFRGTANELTSRVLDCLRISKLNPDKTPENSFAAIQQKKNAENSCTSSGLRWMKDVVLGKRNDHSFRTVVVGDPNLELSQIGIPCQIAESLQVPEYVNRQNKEKLVSCCELLLLEKGHVRASRKGKSILLYKKEQLQIGDIIYRPLNDGDMVLINRPPSIHPHSLIALFVRVLPISSVVSINPLCCSPLRGDFDGDCVHGYIPQSVGTRVELNELVALDRQLINEQSGRNLLSLGQDSLTAAYLLMEDGVLLNIYQMQQLQMFCPHNLKMPAIVKAYSSNAMFWTGMQLFSMLLPPDFDYSYPSSGIFISNGEFISQSESSGWLRDSDCNIFQSLVQCYHEKSLGFLYVAQTVLCEWLSMTGFSVSLSDLYLSSDFYSRKNMMEEIFYGLKEAEYACNFKQLLVDHYRDFLSGNGEENGSSLAVEAEHLNYDRQISAALSQGSVDAFRQVYRDIQSLAFKYGSKDNTLLVMSKAGSKGNILKLVQHSLCLGLQHSLVRLSFRIPHQLSCVAWNCQKELDSIQLCYDTPESFQSYIPFAVVENSFLTGLNPLECFVHSVTSRDSSFSDNADLPGTLTRRLMFFMRDLYLAYDGTVRSSYGNQLIKFSYDTDEESSSNISCQEYTIGGQPVGALSACAISEAAYSALDQPISLLETSPLLNLKNVLECGSKKKSGDQTVSLFLSEKLNRQRYGFEYGALEIKDHLERLKFSDIVSTVMIIFTPQRCGQVKLSPWVCHFHVSKEIFRKRKLKVHSVIDSLSQRCESIRTGSEINLPSLQISCKTCSVADNDIEDTHCITVTIVENPSKPIQLDAVRASLIPYILGTAIKGLPEIKKVDILWNDRSKVSKSKSGSSGELYVRVTVSCNCASGRFWGDLVNHCLPIMNLIDWTRSHPENIRNLCSAYGIDAGWKYFLHSLESAISDTGKSVLPKHLLLVANSLSASGEFVGLNSKGMARQRQHASVSSPFVQACFSNPGSCFIKAAKAGVNDDLRGSLDALAWGNCPSMGTGGQFDIIYSNKEHELAKPVDLYNLLEASAHKLDEKAQNYSSEKWSDRYKKGGYALKELKIFRESIRSKLSFNDILKLTDSSKCILKKYSIDQQLNEKDKSTILRALRFHPRSNEKVGTGAKDINVGQHPEHKDTRCFFVVRDDGTVEDFSYRKCILGALDMIAPARANQFRKRWKVDN